MKNVVLTILQLILFLVVFFLGSLFPPFHFEHVLIATPGTTRIFVADGLVLALVLFVLIVILEAVRKRLRIAAPWTTLAFLLAVVFGLMMKFGFKTMSAF
jgi:uncharacterized membrane protein YpjA